MRLDDPRQDKARRGKTTIGELKTRQEQNKSNLRQEKKS